MSRYDTATMVSVHNHEKVKSFNCEDHETDFRLIILICTS